MIKYYAYFNHGGYKDFYLGSQDEEVEYKYFLPLLHVHELSLIENPDEELRLNVERQQQLAKLLVLSDQTIEFNYPAEARVMMSHSGYKLLYKRLSNQRSVLAIRDIPGTVDSYGRQTPFNVMFVGDNTEDIKSLDIIAEYTRLNITLVEKELNSFFENDFVENGLKFHANAFNSFVERIIATESPLSIDESLNKTVRLFVIPTGITFTNAIREQDLLQSCIYVCYKIDGSIAYKAEKPQQPSLTTDNRNVKSQSTDYSSQRPVEHNIPSLHAMLNVPKREDIEKLWKYIHRLEKRIEQLEINR